MRKKIIISEDSKNEILNQYKGEIHQPLFNYLRRHFTVHTNKIIYSDTLFYSILIDDKLYPLKSNKKNLVNRIYFQIEDLFSDISEPSKRLTIKKFLSDILDYHKLN
jgi:hypothetical protein